MPYESLFDAFPFAGKVILLSIVEGVFIFLWSMLFVIPGIIAAYRYSFAMLNLCENPELGVMEALESEQAADLSATRWQLFPAPAQLHRLSDRRWCWVSSLHLRAASSSALPARLASSACGAWLAADLRACSSPVVGVYLTPYLNLSICRFYLLATAPQVNEPPHFDSWNDNF